MKKKTVLIIIISLIILLLITGGVFAYLFLATDLFKSDKQLFLKYAVNMSNDKNATTLLENYENKKKTTAYENSGSFSVNTDIVSESTDTTVQELKNIIDTANNTNIAFSGKVDNANKKVEQNIQINYSDTVNFPFTYKQEGDIYGLKSDLITPNYIAVENNNLKEFFQKLGAIDVTSVPDKIEVQQLQSISLTDEEKNHLLNTYYIPMFNGLSDEKFTKAENADGSVEYILTLTYQDLKNIVIQMLNTLSTDTMMINKINTILQEMYQDENMVLTSENIQKAVTNLESQTVADGSVTISITQKDGITTGMNVNAGDVVFKITNVQNASSVKYNISLEIQDTSEISLQISYSGLNTNNVTENVSLNLDMANVLNMVYSYDNAVTFGNTVNIEAMPMASTAVLNNYPAEQLQPFMAQLGNAIVQVNTNQMNQIEYPAEFINPMVMWAATPTVYQTLSLFDIAQDGQEQAEKSENEFYTNSMTGVNDILSNYTIDPSDYAPNNTNMDNGFNSIFQQAENFVN